MVDCAAAGSTPHDPDAVGFHKGTVDLCLGILILTNDNGIVILPEEEVRPVCTLAQDILLESQIVRWVRAACFQIDRLIACHLQFRPFAWYPCHVLCRSEIREFSGALFQEGGHALLLVAGSKCHKEPLPDVMTPHTMRHTFCTRMANAGMNPKALQYIMGHANIVMTLNYYAHATFHSAQEEMERLQAKAKTTAEAKPEPAAESAEETKAA